VLNADAPSLPKICESPDAVAKVVGGSVLFLWLMLFLRLLGIRIISRMLPEDFVHPLFRIVPLQEIDCAIDGLLDGRCLFLIGIVRKANPLDDFVAGGLDRDTEFNELFHSVLVYKFRIVVAIMLLFMILSC